uniref:Uncharacterized protein n=1 Tax=Globodera pallida TaxID=36090 RepID=A0A183BKY0_GLOPA
MPVDTERQSFKLIKKNTTELIRELRAKENVKTQTSLNKLFQTQNGTIKICTTLHRNCWIPCQINSIWHFIRSLIQLSQKHPHHRLFSGLTRIMVSMFNSIIPWRNSNNGDDDEKA